VNERALLAALAALTLFSLIFAPWAAINRETGARGTLLLLPNRTVDFTGRTEGVTVPGQGAVLALCALSLVAIAAGAALPERRRQTLWLGAGFVLLTTTVVGLQAVSRATQGAQLTELVRSAQLELADPGRRVDAEALRAVLADAEGLEVDDLAEALRGAGLRIRSLPYETTSSGLAAALCFAVGGLALLLGLRRFAWAQRALGRLGAAVAVPVASIALALVAAAVVILTLQPTPLGGGVTVEGPVMYLAGRLDVLWYAYLSLFASSLGNAAGFMEALKFATPLIFTGLAVAFGFRAGLFNIGAPGQMVLGAIFAAVVGIYLPGPRALVLPLAILAAAVGGGLWGALPGWLKARFGANEVINTILLNYIAASLLLFLLSSQQVFAAPVLRIFAAVGLFAFVLVALSLVPPVRRRLGAAPRRSFAVLGVLLLLAMVFAGLPREGDAPVNLGLAFKAPGSEPKTHELSEAARLPRVPDLVGVPPGTFGAAVVPVNLALPLALAALPLIFWLLGRARTLRWPQRLLLALGLGALLYALLAALGLSARPMTVPPSNLNVSFLISLGAAALMYVILWRTNWGFELRAVGLAPKAAEYGGANLPRNIVWTMALSGAFAGLTACHYVLGGALEDFALRQSLPTSDGFDGIAVALLGQNTPLGVVLAAFLFGVLKNGGSVLNITFPELTRDVVNMVLALVVLFIAARGFLPERLTNPLRRTPAPTQPEVVGGPGARPEREPGVHAVAKEPLDPPGAPSRGGGA
jgi:ABC-type uncharacterized transport system permease subunit